MKSSKVIGTFLVLILALAAGLAAGADRNKDNELRYSSVDQSYKDEASPNGEGVYLASNGSITGNECYGDNGCCCGNSSCGNICLRPDCCPCWTAAADYIVLDRVGGKSQSLLQAVTNTTSFATTEVLNSNDFSMGFHGGPRLSLTSHACENFDVELAYFGVDGWSSARAFTSATTEYMVVVSGEPYYYYGPLLAEYYSRLYNAEVNVKWNPFCRVTMIAGFRWAEIRESITGYQGVTQNNEIIWNPLGNIRTENDLYGFQIGADARLFEYGYLSINSVIKAGVYNNQASQTSADYSGDVFSAAVKHAAFLGEVGVRAKYQVTDNLSLTAAYQAMWIEGVAVAPAQINNVQAIDVNGGLFYHGVSAGLEYSY